MIFKNHIRWPNPDPSISEEMRQKELKEFTEKKKKFLDFIGGRYPVRVQWVPEKYVKIPDNRQPVTPASLGIYLSWVVAEGKNKSERNLYTWAENFTVDTTTKQNKYTPETIDFPGIQTFTDKDEEFLFWLWYAYPVISGGFNSDPATKNEIMFYLPWKQKAEDVAFDSLLTKAKAIIYDEKNLDRLPDLAKSFFIPGVDDMNIAEVQSALKDTIVMGNNYNDKMSNIQRFIDITNDDESLRARRIVQTSIEADLISWNPRTRFYHLKFGGKLHEPAICQVPGNEDSKKYLYEFMAGSKKDELNLLEKTLEEMKSGKKKGKKEVEE